ncbi:acetyltransferase [Bifidobacterium thermacidophilum subsp. thermacidophilum]|uniref:Acetyltransferase n=2 Tax=Bifidobacterium thermacidophilum TaxID=246618 RepID=A0A087E5V8_9BIFI|nr:GNAT family N-acetyltransferase [Bifidobacterium thermacidophilum]KFJ03159.1 acetyltransferase [Bifidobacterium thermacidophilum subsp. thermacidophilum]
MSEQTQSVADSTVNGTVTSAVNSAVSGEDRRELPACITIPEIRGEMVHLRPASIEDLGRLDQLDAFYNASGITGKDRESERAAVNAWVRRSVAWAEGRASVDSGVADPESRPTIAWAILTDADRDGDGIVDAEATDNVIGMIFLIDIDGWSRSARIQVVLGKDYRGRGYSRDAMPRVMTFGFAPRPAGLGMHRIWVAVPEKNTRSLSVYQSLGFIPSGTSRDALWDAENNKYQDLIVMDMLTDEYDPIHSLEVFGMHVFEDNPGVKEALCAREHSLAIRKREHPADGGDHASHAGDEGDQTRRDGADQAGNDTNGQADGTIEGTSTSAGDAAPGISGDNRPADDHSGQADAAQSQASAGVPGNHTLDGEENWPHSSHDRQPSKQAWWRTIGRRRERGTEEDA